MYDWAELRHFRYLLTILEKQGFRAAAEELHTGQPNLSMQARQFQEYASVCLFRKQKSGRIKPTEAGIAFVSLARLLLETRDDVIEALIAIERNEVQSLRFGCSPWVDSALYRQFQRTHTQLLPSCSIRPTYADTTQLANEIAAGTVDAALVVLPLEHPDLHIEVLCQDRIVTCLRKDHPLALNPALRPVDLQQHLGVLYHPERHPAAHDRLIGLLHSCGVSIEDHSHASSLSEMQSLVKEGYGFALIREGIALDEELVTRPIAGVQWTMDTAVIYHRERFPKTLPALVKMLRRQTSRPLLQIESRNVPTHTQKFPSRSVRTVPEQLNLLDKRLQP